MKPELFLTCPVAWSAVGIPANEMLSPLGIRVEKGINTFEIEF